MRELAGSPTARAGLAVGALQADLDRSLLGALTEKRMTQSELKGWLILGSGSALHRHLGRLSELGLLEKRKLAGAPRRVEYGPTQSGRALERVAARVEAWLRRHPERPDELAGELGWRAFLAFNDAWDSALLGRLVGVPRAKGELLDDNAGWGEEKLHRELRRLTGVGLLAIARGRGGADAVALTQWCRLAFGPLAAALRWERVHFPGRATPIPAADAVVGLAAILPLARPLGALAGTCALTVRGDAGPEIRRRAGAVWARVGDGRVRDCGEGTPDGPPDAWVNGDLEAWFAAVLDGSPRGLRIGGDQELATGLIDQLHFELCVSDEPARLGTSWYGQRDTDPED